VARLIGLDVGTSSVKGVAIDEEGTVLGVAERAHPLATPRPGWAEQDPEDWWAGTQAVLAELGCAQADGIGLAGQMHGLVALDAAGKVLRPAILWNDGRTQAQCAEIEERVGLERLIGLTGNRALAGFTAPKLLWLREHEPDTYAAIRHVLLPKDEVRRRLLGGELAMDVSDASGTLLFDVAARDWSEEVCQALDLPREWLPPALESGTLAGHMHVGPTGSACSGLHSREVPVAAGAGDQAAGALGVGVVRAGGAASIVLGTSGVVFAAQDAFAADPQARVHAFCHSVPGAWHAMGVMLSAAGSLRWLRDTVGGTYAELLDAAAGWEPGAEGLVFAPYLAGERTPHADAEARGGFLGLGLRHDRGALTRAVLEGVAFGLADGLDLVTDLAGRPSVGRVSGGGARSALWREIVASVLDLPLEVVAVDEGAAFGGALLGGVAAGVFGSAAEAAEACVRVQRVVEPRPEWVERYAELRPAFRAAWPALQGVRAAAG
jgi:xylulokinase